nr:La39 [Liocheles australasiae]
MRLVSLTPLFLILLIAVDYCQSFPFLLSLIPSAISALKKLGKRSTDFQRQLDFQRRYLNSDLDLDLDELEEFLDQLPDY